MISGQSILPVVFLKINLFSIAVYIQCYCCVTLRCTVQWLPSDLIPMVTLLFFLLFCGSCLDIPSSQHDYVTLPCYLRTVVIIRGAFG